MKIGKKFNTLTLKEYYFYIDNHKKYTDFNTLGLYRSIVENNKLTLDEKKSVRDYAHLLFKKSFDFLQVKDPGTFIELEYLGQELIKSDTIKIWDDIRRNQQRILEGKKIKHRNFGEYSKHYCCCSNCVYTGVMIRPGHKLVEFYMSFNSDKSKHNLKAKSDRRKSDRKNERQIIIRALDAE